MELDKTLDGLRRLLIRQTTCFACSGCGMEHNCSGDGCRIIRSSIEQLQKLSRELATSEAARTELWKQLISARQELAEVKAENDGRLVVLPCKVGDTVYAAETSPVIPLSVAYVGVYLDGADGGDWETLENIGKTIFLTRWEAEAALGGKGSDDR